MNATTHEDWITTWDVNVTAVLGEQDIIQSELAVHLRRGDFLGAATASYEHVLTSVALEDYKEAQLYMNIGQMLSEASLAYMDENLPQIVTFPIPECVPRSTNYAFVVTRMDEDGEATGEWVPDPEHVKLNNAIQDSVAKLESVLLLGQDEDPVIKNTAVRDAIAATSGLIVSKYPIESYDMQERAELLALAKQLSTHLDINVCQESMEIAVDAYEHLMYAAIFTEGKTMGALSVAKRAFTEIAENPCDEFTKASCKKNIATINDAIQAKLLFSTLVPLLRARLIANPHRFNDKWHRIRATKGQQKKAAQAITDKAPIWTLETVNID